MKPIIFFGKEIYIDPVALKLGNIEIYWYGIFIVSAILLCVLLIKKNKDTYNIKYDDIIDFLLGAIISGFIVARIYYIVFNFKYYIESPLEIIKIWNGGLAIYGGIIGAAIYAFIFCRKKKIKFYDLADLLLPYLALAQSIGRWGNFVNREAYGYETNLPLKMGIFNDATNEYMYVHPTFLYESICTFIIFIILRHVSKKRKFEGQVLWLYFILYGVARMYIEKLRTDSLMIGEYRVSEVLSLILIIFSVVMYLYNKKRQKNN